MSEEIRPDEIAKKTVVYEMPGTDRVTISRDIPYRTTDAGDLTMDIYYPPDSKSGVRTPAIVFVTGYPDSGMEKMLGCKFKEMGAYTSWARLTAASGMAAITYTNREPAADILAVLQYVRQNADGLGIDENRIGLWACSGNVPNALSALIEEGGDYLKCAVLCYGMMLDLDESTSVMDAARQWGFVNPSAGKSVADLPKDVPLFIARAGRDQMPHLNETIDRFMIKALSCNLPITFVNHPSAPHAFDLFDPSETTREIIRRILAFMQFHLSS
jgi:hypothetical protein